MKCECINGIKSVTMPFPSAPFFSRLPVDAHPLPIDRRRTKKRVKISGPFFFGFWFIGQLVLKSSCVLCPFTIANNKGWTSCDGFDIKWQTDLNQFLIITSMFRLSQKVVARENDDGTSIQRMNSLAGLGKKNSVSDNKTAKSVVHEVIREFEEERETFQNKAKTALLMTADDLNIGGVHVEDWEETGWAVSIVLLYYLAFFWAFFYFVYSLTLSGTAMTYLSLQSNTTDQICAEIPISVTTTINGDVYGHWSSNPLFLNNASIFVLDFVGTNITTAQYVATMTRFKNQLEILGAKAAQRDVGWNSVM